MTGNDLHIHIPQGFSGTMTVGSDGQVTVTTSSAPTSTSSPTASAAAAIWSTLDPEMAEKMEEMLKRQKGYDPTTRSREIAKELLDRKWGVYSVNLKGAYILFTYAGSQHAVSLYLSSLDLNNAKKSQRNFMLSLDGVDVHGPDVRIPINGKAFQQALINIRAVENWANGQ